MTTTHHPLEIYDAFWVGRLSTAIAMNVPRIPKRPDNAAEDLRRTLDEFLASPLPSAELKKSLKKDLRG